MVVVSEGRKTYYKGRWDFVPNLEESKLNDKKLTKICKNRPDGKTVELLYQENKIIVKRNDGTIDTEFSGEGWIDKGEASMNYNWWGMAR